MTQSERGLTRLPINNSINNKPTHTHRNSAEVALQPQLIPFFKDLEI
jgi:hypothetical protein